MSDPEQALEQVDQVLIGPDERFYVPQRAEGMIRVYDVTGQLLDVFGGLGQGPGEFVAMGDIGILGDDLYVLDSGQGRVSLFSREGEVTQTWPWQSRVIRDEQVVLAPSVPQRLLIRPDTTVLVRPGLTVLDGSSAPLEIPLLWMDRTGEVLDTIALEEMGGSVIRVMNDGQEFFVETPFSQNSMWRFLGNGVGVIRVDRAIPRDPRDASYRVILVDVSHDTVFTELVPYEPIPLSEAVVLRMLGDASVFPRDHANTPDAAMIARAFRSRDLVPNMAVPVSDVVSGQDGTIWIGRELVDTIVAWDVLDSEGRMVGRVELPSEQRVIAVEGDLMVALEYDELDVPYLVAYRLRRGV